jgi:hypothetical protein
MNIHDVNPLDMIVQNLLAAAAGGAIAVYFAAYLESWYRAAHPDMPDEEEREKLEAYTLDFFDELEDLPDRELTDEDKDQLATKFLQTNTPLGTVIMYYDHKHDGFAYYTDRPNAVYYKVLDAVARQYAIQFNCKAVCFNVRQEWQTVLDNYKQAMIRRKQGQELADDEKHISVFAKFKSYKAEPAAAMVLNGSNKFKFKGWICDYTTTKAKQDEEHTVSASKLLSYKEFMLRQATQAEQAQVEAQQEQAQVEAQQQQAQVDVQ